MLYRRLNTFLSGFGIYAIFALVFVLMNGFFIARHVVFALDDLNKVVCELLLLCRNESLMAPVLWRDQKYPSIISIFITSNFLGPIKIPYAKKTVLKTADCFILDTHDSHFEFGPYFSIPIIQTKLLDRIDVIKFWKISYF